MVRRVVRVARRLLLLLQQLRQELPLLEVRVVPERLHMLEV
jgi:hypothetical protein